MLEYVYTGSCSAVHMGDALEILKLANFLCLPRLVAICEQHIIKETDASLEKNQDTVMENILGMFKCCQIYLSLSVVIKKSYTYLPFSCICYIQVGLRISKQPFYCWFFCSKCY